MKGIADIIPFKVYIVRVYSSHLFDSGATGASVTIVNQQITGGNQAFGL